MKTFMTSLMISTVFGLALSAMAAAPHSMMNGMKRRAILAILHLLQAGEPLRFKLL